ncbi:helix-turn-helix transcriptional regulator [Deinococcus sp. QL22]|uniref:helix-turn-helix domain-containing protein n=1 Tax=Deinococcus sp. QL22 TaxID=2939437 RepID=UPI002017C12F|nr:helix-turn-helix transcriptional regulator [Deinococcus sp. QL22]UQN07404.1 helix-turn-helix transcriptional regulator [Deinococcus sp. QL22]
MKTAKDGAALGVFTGRASHLGYQTPGPTPYAARVTVREACEARGLSVYQVAMSGYAQGTVDPGTVYRLARGDTSRIDLYTLATIAGILHTLTGQRVDVGELLALEVDGKAVQSFEMADLYAWKEGR